MPAADTPAYPEINAGELRAILDHITAHPETWWQEAFAALRGCGTAYCVAGHAVHRAHPGAEFLFFDHYGHPAHYASQVELADGTEQSVSRLATALLGLTEAEAAVLFDADNALADLEHMYGVLTDPAYRRTIEGHQSAGRVAVR